MAVHLKLLSGIYHLLDVVLQLTAGTQGEQLIDDSQGITRHNGGTQADHIVIIEIQLILKLLPLVGLLQADAVALPVVVFKGFLHGQGNLLGVLGHGGIEDQRTALCLLIFEALQLGGFVIPIILGNNHAAGHLCLVDGDLLLGRAALSLEDDGITLGMDVLQQLAAAVGRHQLALIGPGIFADDHLGLPLAAGGVHEVGISTCEIHVVSSLYFQWVMLVRCGRGHRRPG